MEQVCRLSDGVERLKEGGIAAVLLDLYLPDSQGIKTFEELFAVTSWGPVLGIADREHEAAAWQATQRGAHDHLLKDHLDNYWLPRVLRSAIERRAVDDAFLLSENGRKSP